MQVNNGLTNAFTQIKSAELFLSQSPIESVMKVSDSVSYILTSVVYGDGSHFEA